MFSIADATLYSFGFGYLVSEFEADLKEVTDEVSGYTGVSYNANDITAGNVVYNPMRISLFMEKQKRILFR